MANTYVNKVVQSDGTTLIDITDTTAVASDVAAGKYFYGASGEKLTGTASGGSSSVTLTQDANGYIILPSTGSGGSSSTTTVTIIPEQTVTASGHYTQINYLAPLELGETYTYYINGIESESLAFDNYGTVAIGSPESTTGFEYGNNIMYFSVGNSSLYGSYTIKVEKDVSATSHTIHLEFSDSTTTDIGINYSDPLIGTIITAYEPSVWTYNAKTVYTAELDGVEWYDATPSSYTWTTLYDGNPNFTSEPESGDSYAYIEALANVAITEGSVWRVTWGNEVRVHNAVYGAPWSGENAKWHINSMTDGTSGVYVITPFNNNNAWLFVDFDDTSSHSKYVKIEQASS